MGNLRRIKQSVSGSVFVNDKADTITVEVTSSHLLLEFRHNVWSETEFTGHEDLLTAGELETTSVEGLLGVLHKLWLGTD